MVTKAQGGAKMPQSRINAPTKTETPRSMLGAVPKPSISRGQEVYCKSYKEMKKS